MVERFEEIEGERMYDVEETIFVAVGKNVEKSKTTLSWALQSFPGKRICLLHVRRPSDIIASTDKKLPVHDLKQDKAAKRLQLIERKNMHDILNEYCLILAEEGVQADSVWIQKENIERGIVELIARYNIRWLVMGAAADKYYSKKLAELNSKKAIFVCQYAPISCHIWFTCKGCLICTRESRYNSHEAETALPLSLLNADFDTVEPDDLRSESVAEICSSLGRLPTNMGNLFDDQDTDEDVDDIDRISESFNRQCMVISSQSTNTSLSSPEVLLLTYEEEEKEGSTTEKNCSKLEEAIKDAKDSKKKTYEEAAKRWKEEDDAMEAKCKAKALERLYLKEINLRKEMEEALDREKQEAERTKNQCDGLMKELQSVQESNSVLESRFTESHDMMKELEEKFFSAVELLIVFKKRRDAALLEYENAMRRVNRLRKWAQMDAKSYCKSEILEFSFIEINEATHNFDPSWKIGEGRYGNVYKGLLRHTHVAIKMLPSYGSKSRLDFQNGVELLSRVRHPNLVTMLGTCPESRSLVYEFVRNGSLEDCLTCKNKTSPLPWQTRASIAFEICSALIFLHSNKPCIIHGNLKPSKVLLDANFVSKLSDFGIFHLISHSETATNNSLKCNKSNSIATSVYIDPEYLETGVLTPESDVYSFGIILLRLLTERPALGIVKDVKCALENDNFRAVLDFSAGDWPLEQTKQLAYLALRCTENNRLNRPNLVSEISSVLEPMKASSVVSASCLDSKEPPRKIPSHFMCPIFQEVMKDPHIAADGFTYDADAIRGWLKSGHYTSPMTNLKLQHCNLLPNHALHQAILEWRQHW